MMEWFRVTLVNEGMVSPEDMHLIQVIDEPEVIIESIFKHYATRGFDITTKEREMLLTL